MGDVSRIHGDQKMAELPNQHEAFIVARLLLNIPCPRCHLHKVIGFFHILPAASDSLARCLWNW